MTHAHSGRSETIRPAGRRSRPRILSRLDWLLSGLAHGIDQNRPWLRIYVTSVILAISLHLYLERAPFSSVIGFLSGFDVWTEVLPAAAAFLLISPLLGWGRRRHYANRRRPFGRLVMVFSVFGSLALTTIPLLSLVRLIVPSLLAGALACGLATLLMGIILIFPATSFHPDFAHLRMFRRSTLILELASGFLLFLVAAQQLLLWPTPIRQPLSPQDFFDRLTSPLVPYQIFPDLLIDFLALSLTVVILALAVIGLYLHLAHRWWRGNVFQTIRGGFRLLIRNLRYRIGGRGGPIWPTLPTIDPSAPREDPRSGQALEEFTFSSTLPAVSLAFALWVPQAVWTEGLTGSSVLALVVLVLFLAGGIDIWVRAIQVAGTRGSSYTLGLWLGTLSLYWATTLTVVLVITDAANFPAGLGAPSADDLVNLQNTFALWYRAALGALTVLVAVGQLRQSASESGPPRALRYGLATVAILVLTSLVVNALGSALGSAHYVRVIAFGSVAATTAAAILVPRWRHRHENVRPYGAQLVASPSAALAPLLFSQRVDQVQWSGEGYADVTVRNVGISPEPLRLRIYVAGSEDEVAFEAMSRAHARLRGPFDFVLTDLRTAIRIMGAYRAGRHKHAAHYRIMCVVAAVPWQRVSVAQSGGDSPRADGMILDAGYLRFTPRFAPPPDLGSPCTLARHRCRPASLDTVAYYAANPGRDVGEAFITEPYYSWLRRQSVLRGHPPVESDPEQLEVYVLLARYHTHSIPAVAYNWRRTFCEMIHEGQTAARENQGIVNHAQLHRLHSFIQNAINPRLELQLEDIHLAVCRSRFGSQFPSERSVGYELAIQELYCNNLISHAQMEQLVAELHGEQGTADCGQVMRRALEAAQPPVTDSDKPEDERFFQVFYGKDSRWAGERGRDGDMYSYLHSLALVPLPDRPGELTKLLEKLRAKSAGEVDLALLASANLGECALVYLLNRRDLPSPRAFSRRRLGKPIKAKSHSAEWIGQLNELDCDAVEIKAFMVPVQNRRGGLGEVVSRLSGSGRASSVNIEEVFAFPIDKKRAVALLVTKAEDWEIAYDMLTGREEHPRPTELRFREHSDEVALGRRFPTSRHTQQAVFRRRLEPGARIRFECEGLATWTPTWGSIDGWLAELRFREVRLQIPTALIWQCTLMGWIGDIPLLGRWIRRLLASRIPGIAGREAYLKKSRWFIVVDGHEEEPAAACEGS